MKTLTKSKKQLKNLAPSLHLLYSCLLLLCCFSGCGRKRRYPFSFAEKKTTVSIATLDLCSVQNVRVLATAQGNKIVWNNISVIEQQKHNKINAHFVGYNIYRLTTSGFIPKEALNKIPTKKTTYTDTKKKSNNSYAVRAVFKQNNKFILGPLSRIAQPDNKK